MPPRKEVASLRNLCIDNIALNIVKHGELFKRHRGNEKVNAPYKLLQFLFTDALMEKLFEIFEQDSVGGDLKRLRNFLFFTEEARNPDEWPCLEILFSEYTASVFPLLSRRHQREDEPRDHGTRFFKEKQAKLSEGVLSFIAIKCKDLRQISETFCFLAGKAVEKIVPEFRNLQEVDLGSIENAEVLKIILRTCVSIRKLKANGRKNISDEFLLSLCNHSSQSEEFTLCPANGKCSNIGKYLENLHVTFLHTTGVGIACSLEHLPVLKSLAELPIEFESRGRNLPDASRGIILLQNAAIANGRPPVILELSAIHLLRRLTEDELHTVLMSCPRLEIVQVDLSVVSTAIFSVGLFAHLKELHLLNSSNDKLNSSELKKFLSAVGKQIEVLSFIHSTEPLDLTYVDRIMESCCNLKSFVVLKIEVSERNYDHPRRVPSFRTKLDRISLHVLEPREFPPPERKYFRDLICSAVNLKYLRVASVFAENDFLRIIEMTDFKFLEELFLHYCDPRNVPFQKLLSGSDNLRKISFDGYFGGFLLLKDLARERNYAIDFINFDSRASL